MSPLIPRAAAEFPPGASLPPDGLSRRDFLRLGTTTAVLAGAAGCSRPARTLVPAVLAPEDSAPDGRDRYASASPWDGYGRGILVATHDGRPTKIEGNPAHADSGGATDATAQAAVRALYDPERPSTPRGPGGRSTWQDFEAAWHEGYPELTRTGGAGWAIMTEPTTSPTLRRLIAGWRARFPRARWYQHTALGRWDEASRQVDLRVAQADVIVAIEADFLHRHPAALRYARDFAVRRRSGGRSAPNRLYVAESAWTITGGMADVRLAIAPSRVPALLRAIDRGGAPAAGDRLSLAESAFASQAAADLRAAGPAAAVLAGPEQARAVAGWAAAANRRGGSIGGIVFETAAVRSDGEVGCGGGAADLADALRDGQVDRVCLLSVDPIGTTGAGLDLRGALGRARFSACLSEVPTATAAACGWHLPESHFLESWGDLRGFDGTLVLQQPLIEPLGDTTTAAELLHRMTDGLRSPGFSLVRATHAVDDDEWNRWLGQGRGPS